MKKTILLICLLFASGSLHSQTQPGTWELSVSGNLGSVSISSETRGSYTSSYSESHSFFSLALRPGYYIVNDLALEPEVFWTAIEGDLPSFSLSGNLSYNFRIPDSQVKPFVLIGYGIGNAIPVFQRVFYRASDKFDIPVLHLGAGLKVFLTKRIALRTEYRYQRYSYEQTYHYDSYNYTIKTKENFHNVFFGFSVFLP